MRLPQINWNHMYDKNSKCSVRQSTRIRLLIGTLDVVPATQQESHLMTGIIDVVPANQQESH